MAEQERRRAKRWWLTGGVLALLVAAPPRHESRQYRDAGGGVVASYSGVLLPWQSLPTPRDRDALASVSIRRWGLLGLSVDEYTGPPGLVAGYE